MTRRTREVETNLEERLRLGLKERKIEDGLGVGKVEPREVGVESCFGRLIGKETKRRKKSSVVSPSFLEREEDESSP